MKPGKPTAAQRRLLEAVIRCGDGPAREGTMAGIGYEWGNVKVMHNENDGTPSQFEMRNFDASANACIRRGWIYEYSDGSVDITTAGRAAIKESTDG